MNNTLALLSGVVIALALLTSCNAPENQTSVPPKIDVGIVVVETQSVTIINELPGRVVAHRVAEVRARAAGILLKREFIEGSDVTAGDILFRIDPRPLKAALGSAQATLAKGEATLSALKAKVERIQPLLGTNAISKQDYDDAVALRDQAIAEVALAQAALVTAQLQLDYTDVTAPISGRIGRALVTEGALVGQDEATPLAIIQQLDPIQVDLTQSSTVLLGIKRAIAEGRLAPLQQPTITLLSQTGDALPHKGTLAFTDAVIDASTSSIILRAEFPNPDHLLLPGMYLRARLEQAISENAIIIPQQAVNRRPEGASVLIVNAENVLEERAVQIENGHGNSYIISSGLSVGDRVVVDGLQKARAGSSVNTVAWTPPPAGDPTVTAISASAK
jgi:membrane fusion protein (multidrug efflux system)